jgi:hypothetical protein
MSDIKLLNKNRIKRQKRIRTKILELVSVLV